MLLSHIASILLERKAATANPLVMIGEIRQQLGHDGFAEALNRRWLIPDLNIGGTLSITSQAPRLIEMETAMSNPDELVQGDEATIVGSDGRTYAGVVSVVSPDKTKVSLAFANGRPPGTSEDAQYDTKAIKVTKKATPDVRTKVVATPTGDLASAAAQPNTYNGMSH